VEFGLLGPLLIRDGGRTVRLPPRQRVLLAALLLRPGQVIAADELAAAVWDGRLPGGRGALHTAVQRLRSALGLSGLIRTCSPGYVIEIGDGELDIRRFAALAVGGRAAARAGEWARAAEDCRAALGLWRGEPLADIPSPLLRARELPHLEEHRLAVLATRIDADLHLGRADLLVAELRQLVAAHPLREGFHAQLMLALYRSGRQADALAAYQDARRLLAEEVGADPGADLRDLHQRMLCGDPGLMPSAPLADAGPRAQAAIPRQLPAAVRHFAGRITELAALAGLVEETVGPGATVVISAVGGTAGIGKTALAVHFAHLAADRFPDGQLYVDLRGFGPAPSPVRPAEAIRSFLDAFGVDPRQIPADVGAQASLYRSLLAGKRVLVVLDNARDAEQVRPLLPGTPGCLVLVTSRSQLTSLVAAEDAYPLALDLLPADEARDLLTRRLGPRTDASTQTMDELAGLCARLPLALSITAARAAVRPGLPLAATVAELREARDRLGAFDAGDEATSISTVFSWSYDLLSDQAARMFRLISLHPGAAISGTAAASIAALPAAQAQHALRELCHAHLIAESGPGRYSFHDLLRAYAAERTAACDSAAERSAATRRMLDHYLHTAHAAALLLNPMRRPLALSAPEDGMVPDRLAAAEQALAWFEGEYRNALAVAERAVDVGCDAHAWQIPSALSRFFDRRGLWREWADSELAALAAARRQGDPAGEADAHHLLGYAHFRLGDYRQADACLRRSLQMYTKLGDQGQQARVHFTFTMACELQCRPDEALSHAQSALLLARAAGERAYLAYPLNAVGWSHAQLGNYQQALAYCRQALTLHRECGNPQGEADTWDSLGYAYHHLGRHAEAINCYTRALDIYRRVGDLWATSIAMDHLGDTKHAAGNLRGAREAWQRALGILDDLGHAKADEIRNKLSSLD
jgi:DNA-binding SARP family transcriptional activator/Flp pilus assembly protein TadD